MSDTQGSRSPKHRYNVKKTNNRKKNTSRKIVLVIAIVITFFIAALVEFLDMKIKIFACIDAVMLFLSELMVQIVCATEKNKMRKVQKILLMRISGQS